MRVQFEFDCLAETRRALFIATYAQPMAKGDAIVNTNLAKTPGSRSFRNRRAKYSSRRFADNPARGPISASTEALQVQLFSRSDPCRPPQCCVGPDQ